MTSIQLFSRGTGAVYLLVAITGAFGIAYVQGLVVANDITATINILAANKTTISWAIFAALLTQIGHLVLVLMLYKILAPVNEAIAKLMVIFVLVGLPIAMLNEASYGAILGQLGSADGSSNMIAALISFHAYGIIIVQIFWGLWLFPFGYLVYKSGFLPKIIGVTLMIGCFGYLADSLIYIFNPNFPIRFSIYLFWGELIILFWLLIMGINVEKWERLKK